MNIKNIELIVAIVSGLCFFLSGFIFAKVFG